MSLLDRIIEASDKVFHKRKYIKTQYGDIWFRPDFNRLARETDVDPKDIQDFIGGCAVMAMNSYHCNPAHPRISLPKVEIQTIRYNADHKGNNKTFFCKAHAKGKGYTFFVKLYDDDERLKKDLEILKILEGEGVAMLPRKEGDRTLIFTLADGSLEQSLAKLHPKDLGSKEDLLRQAVDRLVDFYACTSRHEHTFALQKYGIEDKELSEDIERFFAATFTTAREAVDTLAVSARNALEDVLNTRILPKIDTDGPKSRKGTRRKWARIIHNDSYSGNFNVDGDKVMLHDFESIAFGPAEYDLATLFAGLDAPYAMKESMIQHAFNRMSEKGLTPNSPTYDDFRKKVHAATIIRGLWVMGWVYDNYDNLTEGRKRQKKRKVKDTLRKLNTLYSDAIVSALYFDNLDGTVGQDGGINARAIRDYVEHCLDDRIAFVRMYKEAEMIHQGLGETPAPPASIVDRAIERISDVYENRKKHIAYSASGLAAIAVLYGALTTCGSDKQNLKIPQPTIISVAPPSGNGTPEPCDSETQSTRKHSPKSGSTDPTYISITPDPEPTFIVLPPTSNRRIPPDAQKPGNAEDTDPEFCKDLFVLNDEKDACVKNMYRPDAVICDPGFWFNKRKARCDSRSDARHFRHAQVRCPYPNYSPALSKEGNVWCHHSNYRKR
jgi:Ser/Thr protein kinase RdoA (MazF antagonist)